MYRRLEEVMVVIKLKLNPLLKCQSKRWSKMHFSASVHDPNKQTKALGRKDVHVCTVAVYLCKGHIYPS